MSVGQKYLIHSVGWNNVIQHAMIKLTTYNKCARQLRIDSRTEMIKEDELARREVNEQTVCDKREKPKHMKNPSTSQT